MSSLTIADFVKLASEADTFAPEKKESALAVISSSFAAAAEYHAPDSLKDAASALGHGSIGLLFSTCVFWDKLSDPAKLKIQQALAPDENMPQPKRIKTKHCAEPVQQGTSGSVNQPPVLQSPAALTSVVQMQTPLPSPSPDANHGKQNSPVPTVPTEVSLDALFAENLLPNIVGKIDHQLVQSILSDFKESYRERGPRCDMGMNYLNSRDAVHDGFGILLGAVSQHLSVNGAIMPFTHVNSQNMWIENTCAPGFVMRPSDSQSALAWRDIAVIVEVLDMAFPFDFRMLTKRVEDHFARMWKSQPRSHVLGITVAAGIFTLWVGTRSHIYCSHIGRVPFAGDGYVLTREDIVEVSDSLMLEECGIIIRVLVTLFMAPAASIGRMLLEVDKPNVFIISQDTNDPPRCTFGHDLGGKAYKIRYVPNSFDCSNCVGAVGACLYKMRVRVWPKDSLGNYRRALHGNYVLKVRWHPASAAPTLVIYSRLNSLRIPNVEHQLIYGTYTSTPSNGKGDVLRCDVSLVESNPRTIRPYVTSICRCRTSKPLSVIDIIAGYVHALFAAYWNGSDPILHCNIMPESLLVLEGKALVSGWETAQCSAGTGDPKQSGGTDAARSRSYAGWRVLRNTARHSLADDLESLFLVLYDCSMSAKRMPKHKRLRESNSAVDPTDGDTAVLNDRLHGVYVWKHLLNDVRMNCPMSWVKMLCYIHQMLFSVYKPTLDGFSCLSTDPRMDVFHIPDWIATFANILGNEQRLAPGFQGLRRFCYELSLRPEMSPFFNTSNAVIARHHVEQQMKGFSAVDSCASPANYSSES